MPLVGIYGTITKFKIANKIPKSMPRFHRASATLLSLLLLIERGFPTAKTNESMTTIAITENMRTIAKTNTLDGIIPDMTSIPNPAIDVTQPPIILPLFRPNFGILFTKNVTNRYNTASMIPTKFIGNPATVNENDIIIIIEKRL